MLNSTGFPLVVLMKCKFPLGSLQAHLREILCDGREMEGFQQRYC